MYEIVIQTNFIFKSESRTLQQAAWNSQVKILSKSDYKVAFVKAIRLKEDIYKYLKSATHLYASIRCSNIAPSPDLKFERRILTQPPDQRASCRSRRSY